MSKRLSSIFSLSKDDHGTDHKHSLLPQSTSNPSLNIPPAGGKLHKTTSPSSAAPRTTYPDPTLPVTPLAPPPLLTGDGMIRPPSSAGSGSRPPSQASARSRPQTPTFAITPVEGNSPIQPTTPSSAHRLKKHTWGGKLSKGNKDAKQSQAWIAGLPDHVPYDLSPLLKGERVGTEKAIEFAADMKRYPTSGMNKRIPSSTCIRDHRAEGLHSSSTRPCSRIRPPSNCSDLRIPLVQDHLQLPEVYNLASMICRCTAVAMAIEELRDTLACLKCMRPTKKLI